MIEIFLSVLALVCRPKNAFLVSRRSVLLATAIEFEINVSVFRKRTTSKRVLHYH